MFPVHRTVPDWIKVSGMPSHLFFRNGGVFYSAGRLPQCCRQATALCIALSYFLAAGNLKATDGTLNPKEQNPSSEVNAS